MIVSCQTTTIPNTTTQTDSQFRQTLQQLVLLLRASQKWGQTGGRPNLVRFGFVSGLWVFILVAQFNKNASHKFGTLEKGAV